jgi:amidase
MSRDVTGPIGRCVEDVATLLGGMVGVDPYDEVTATSEGRYRSDYRRFLDPDGLRGARIGIWRDRGYFGVTDRSQDVFDAVVPLLRDLGATVIDPVEIPFMEASVGNHVGVMIDEFRHGIRRYLAGLTNTGMRTLGDLIAFNEANADAEMPWFGQGMFTAANDVRLTLSSPAYLKELRVSRTAGRRGFAKVMGEHRLDALFAPTWRESWAIDLVNHDPPWSPGASGPSNAAGYPHITVPAGYVGELPVGASFLARAWEEPKLLRFAYAFEQAVRARREPRFLEGYGVSDFVDR